MNVENEVVKPQKEESLGDLIRFGVVAALIVFGIRTYVAHPFVVSGSSMEPAFSSGQYLVVDELSYRLREPHRGEVVIFKYPNDTTRFFIKRIVGLPGETVVIKSGKVIIKSEENETGMTIEEPYARGYTGRDTEEVLGDDEYFVLGDNREASSDSRVWGSLERELIVGRALIRLFPVAKADILPGNIE